MLLKLHLIEKCLKGQRAEVILEVDVCLSSVHYTLHIFLLSYDGEAQIMSIKCYILHQNTQTYKHTRSSLLTGNCDLSKDHKLTFNL